MGYTVKKLVDLSIESLINIIHQIDDFPSNVPCGLLGIFFFFLNDNEYYKKMLSTKKEMIFARLSERKQITTDVLDLFIRSPIQSLVVKKAKIVGI